MTLDRNSKNFSFLGQIGILLGLIGGGLLVGSVISAGVWIGMTGRSVFSMESDLQNPKYYNAFLIMQAISTLFMFFLPVIVFAKICYKDAYRFLGFKTSFNYKQVLWVVVILALTFPLSGALAELTKIIPIPKNWEIKFKAMEAARESQEAAIININSFYKYAMSMLIIGVLPGIFEEVLFRGGIQNIFTRWTKNPWVAIIATSIIFSIIHLSYYGFFVRFALGIILGLVFYYSGSLWLAIILHFLYNGLQVTALYVLNLKPDMPASKDIEQNFPAWAGVIALALIVYAFKKLRDLSTEEREKFVYEEP
ncbi:MAG: CPBP family intramembrane glutamic endopeptidase, partial [Ginsengibacter sp.]